jgi:hypothetical protein
VILRWAPTAGAALLAAAMFAALRPSAHGPSEPPAPTVAAHRLVPTPLSRRVTTGRVAVRGAFRTGPGPDGRVWKGVGDDAYIDVAGAGRRWLAFRVGSYGVPRRLNIVALGRMSRPARITTSAVPVLFGPFGVKTSLRFAIKGSPPSRSPAPGAPAGDFFLSEPVLSAVPAAMLPGAGFWPIEYSGARRAVWLRDYGVAIVIARRGTRRAWLRFRTFSLVRQRLVVRMADPPRKHLATIDVFPNIEVPVLVGPIRLVRGMANVRFDASPGASPASGGDSRPVSVEFKDFDVALRLGR